ncbi:hypothetical protein FB45DRAFT_361866 [Roridomyces roridus]|uniref:Microbial-type PARG catalytic domain-containing protein n=1 Tax=Roridomyces roridus TaxID=1738132 RepID=A0AAD7FWY9_9AGAR|nr:hypothetical protein FB45DRAFT_361866 [Roridomyces roridus]
MTARDMLREIAETTLTSISSGKITVQGYVYDLSSTIVESKLRTAYYEPDSLLSLWQSSSPAQPLVAANNTVIEFLETTTLDAARSTGVQGHKTPIGVLNFASAEQPGGGFINGMNAQEESIARSSTLYASLMTPTAQQFYSLHTEQPHHRGFYTHAMIYSPNVVAFRTDDGAAATPMLMDVVTSPAVHAGLVRKQPGSTAAIEVDITHTMHERMARILFLFERRAVRSLVLGSFGTGVFMNEVDVVASIWAQLLCGPTARFARSFDYVAFAVVDRSTYERFRKAFERQVRFLFSWVRRWS